MSTRTRAYWIILDLIFHGRLKNWAAEAMLGIVRGGGRTRTMARGPPVVPHSTKSKQTNNENKQTKKFSILNLLPENIVTLLPVDC